MSDVELLDTLKEYLVKNKVSISEHLRCEINKFLNMTHLRAKPRTRKKKEHKQNGTRKQVRHHTCKKQHRNSINKTRKKYYI